MYSYVGNFRNGKREGPGVQCFINADGSTVPVVYCMCRDDKVEQFERFRGTSPVHSSLMKAVQMQMIKAVDAAERCRRQFGTTLNLPT